MNVSNVEITAGLGGFLVLFGMGLVVWFLGRDLSRRLRGMRQREELRIRSVQAAAKNAPPSKDGVPTSGQNQPGRANPSDPSGDAPLSTEGDPQDPKRSQE